MTAEYRLEDMARDVEDLMHALNIKRAHIAGVSLGGMIAQVFAARAPHRTLSLTCISTATGNPRTGLGNLSAIRALLQKQPEGTDDESLRNYFRFVMGVIGTQGEIYDESFFDGIIKVTRENGITEECRSRQLMAILASGDRRAQLRQLSVPTLVIHGTADPLLPLRAGKETADCIEGAHFMLIDGMGHDLAASRQQEIADAIHECGMIYMHHADCICQPLVEDMVEIGVDIWQGVIPQNDIVEIQRITHNQLAMVGGIDGPKLDVEDITEEEIRAHVRHAIDTYCAAGRFFPSIPNGVCFREWNDRIVKDELKKYGREYVRQHPVG